jgi:pimeloyl-ACP methyl ester carboxylesterase
MRDTRWLIGVAGFIGLLAAAVYGHQKRFEARCSTRVSPGSMVLVHGESVNVWCQGAGDPLVLMEASELGGSLEYERVLRSVARRTTACAWDRPGMGLSPPTKSGTSVPEQGERIMTALAIMGKTGAYGRIVTVGASAGGLVSLYLARQYPKQVVGVVLVDAIGPEAVDRLPGQIARLGREARLAAVGAHLGLLPIIDPLNLSDADACETYWPENFDASADLLSGLPESVRLLRKTPPLPPTTQLVVLRHGRQGDFLGNGVNFEEQSAMEPAWASLQQNLAATSKLGRSRVIARSGHRIHVEQPESVVQAIDDVIDTVGLRRFPCLGDSH